MEKPENSQLLRLIRSDLRENFKPYSSAGSESGKTQGTIYLNANENPFEINGLNSFNRYDVQQPQELLAALSKTYGVSSKHIIATRGSDESIDLLIRMMCQARQDTILTCSPTFGMYRVYGTLQGAKHLDVPLIEKNGTFLLDVPQIIETATDPDNHVKILFLCTPNNPTGTLFSEEDILAILEATSDSCAVVIDEAYQEFTAQDSFIEKLSNYSHLIILRTLSKAYALAGERLGCAISEDTDFMAYMRGCLAPYPLAKSVSASAITALSASSDNNKIKILIEERERMKQIFQNSEDVQHVYPSEANFLLVKFASINQAQSFLSNAEDKNIILRDFSNTPGTEACVRVSIGTNEENDLVASLL